MFRTMDSSLIAACVSATVTAVGLFLGYIQWRRDVRVKVDEIRKEVSLKLVTERIEPYTELMQGLEIASTFHREGLQPELGELLDALQKAIYGRVGLLDRSQPRLQFRLAACRRRSTGEWDCLLPILPARFYSTVETGPKSWQGAE